MFGLKVKGWKSALQYLNDVRKVALPAALDYGGSRMAHKAAEEVRNGYRSCKVPASALTLASYAYRQGPQGSSMNRTGTLIDSVEVSRTKVRRGDKRFVVRVNPSVRYKSGARVADVAEWLEEGKSFTITATQSMLGYLHALGREMGDAAKGLEPSKESSWKVGGEYAVHIHGRHVWRDAAKRSRKHNEGITQHAARIAIGKVRQR